MIRKTNIREIIAPHFYTTFNSKKTNQIYEGGRNSTKTSMIALKIVTNCLNNDNCSAVCLRNHKIDLRTSVYREIKRACAREGLAESIDYKATVSPMEITFFKNENKIYFAGGDDFEAVKGTIDEKKLIKIVWFEELTNFKDEETIEQIKATFTRGNNDWFMALYSYNPPKNKYDWVNQWAEKKKKDTANYLVHHSDYRTVNPDWVGKLAIQEAENLKKNDPKRYDWIWLGHVIGIEGLIYNPDLIEYVDEDYIKNNNVQILYLDFSTDSGHQTSATACGCYGLGNDGYFYLLDTYYYSPNEKPDKKAPSELSKDLFEFKRQMIMKFKSVPDRETIDSAEGALRNQYYKDFGIRLNPVDKGTNKEQLVDYSQDFIAKKKFRVLNNNNNQIFKKENINYQWLEDSIKKGKPIPDKTEKEFPADEKYWNTHSKSFAYTYADHTQDEFQYWVKDNLVKLGLKF